MCLHGGQLWFRQASLHGWNGYGAERECIMEKTVAKVTRSYSDTAISTNETIPNRILSTGNTKQTRWNF